MKQFSIMEILSFIDNKDNKVIFLRHSGMFIRCSPNQLLKTSDNAINTFQPTTGGKEFDHPDKVKLPNQSTITSNQ